MERDSHTTSTDSTSRRRLRVIVDLWEDSAELAGIFPMTNSDEGDRKVRKIIAERFSQDLHG
jgi:hypothetical protein